MDYKCRPGVVLEKICGVYLLIPSLEAFEFCPNVMRLTLLSAIIWGGLKNGKAAEDIEKVLMGITKKDEQEAQRLIEETINSFVKAGAVVKEGEA